MKECSRIESVKRPQNNVTSLSLELAAASWGELVITKYSPELRRGLSHAGNALDEVILKLGIICSVVREAKIFRRLVQGCSKCASWLRVGI